MCPLQVCLFVCTSPIQVGSFVRMCVPPLFFSVSDDGHVSIYSENLSKIFFKILYFIFLQNSRKLQAGPKVPKPAGRPRTRCAGARRSSSIIERYKLNFNLEKDEQGLYIVYASHCFSAYVCFHKTSGFLLQR